MDVPNGYRIEAYARFLEQGIGDFGEIKVLVVMDDPAKPVGTEMLEKIIDYALGLAAPCRTDDGGPPSDINHLEGSVPQFKPNPIFLVGPGVRFPTEYAIKYRCGKEYRYQYVKDNMFNVPVHTPMEAKEEDLAKFKGHPRQALAAMTWSLDENIGKVVQALKNKGVVENTLIFFLSDNGGAHNNQSSTGPLKGWKGNKFEGGHRVPLVVSWPGQLPSGNSLDSLTSSLDIFSTAVKAANIEVDDELILDGVNLLPYLRKAKSGPPHEKLFWRKLDESAVRMGNKKLIDLKGFGSVMYDLKNDLGETFDLTRVLPTEKSQIEQEYLKWETELMKPLWDEGPIWMPITRHIHKSLMSNEEPEYKDPWGKK
ncbi:hypothetical protein ZORO111903_06840 [Zobellia roscoffensis]